MVKTNIQRYYHLIYLFSCIISSIGSFLMGILCKETLYNKSLVANHILFFIAICDLIYSLAGIITGLLNLFHYDHLYYKYQWYIIIIGSIHYSFEIASFLWTSMLAFYILFKRKSNLFPMKYSHFFIWFIVIIYYILEIIALNEKNTMIFTYIVRMIWVMIALLSIVFILLTLYILFYQYSKSQLKESIIISRFSLYLISFILFVCPNIIVDIYYFINKINISISLNEISCILFALLPFMNSLIYFFQIKYPCFINSSNQMNNHPIYNRNQRYSNITTIGTNSLDNRISKSSFSTNYKYKYHTTNNNIQEIKGLEIDKIIGKGLSTVYKGKWRGIYVAIKMPNIAIYNNISINTKEINEIISNGTFKYKNELQKEAISMRSLTHPNIVLFMEAGFFNGYMCIITEYCMNGSLRDVIENNKIHLRCNNNNNYNNLKINSTFQYYFNTNNDIINSTLLIKLNLALDIAYGLEYLHENTPPMIHRDLKSPNIMIDENWRAKIGDFGTLRISCIFNKVIKNNKINLNSNDKPISNVYLNDINFDQMTGHVGTTRWMAPELIYEEKYNEKVDIYSFSIIMWELIEEKLPFYEYKWNYLIEDAIIAGNRPIITKKLYYENNMKNKIYKLWFELIINCWDSNPFNRPTIKYIVKKLKNMIDIIEKSKKYNKLNNNFTKKRKTLKTIKSWTCLTPVTTLSPVVFSNYQDF